MEARQIREREAMVRRQIQARGIRDERVLAAMRSVPRHLFVPSGSRSEAYADHPVYLAEGQTVSQPYIVAFMTEILSVGPDHRVLEIGTGSGYQTAVLASLAETVYSIERLPALSASAALRLDSIGVHNTLLKTGDGSRGWPAKAPFDRIIVTAAAPALPSNLRDQLAPGGRIVIPEGRPDAIQNLFLYLKRRSGSLDRRFLFSVRFVPLVSDHE